MLQQGDLVTRISYGHDLLFRVYAIDGHLVRLYGEDLRLEADAPVEDLTKVNTDELRKIKEAVKEQEDYSFRLFRQDYQLMRRRREYDATSGYKQKTQYFQLPSRVLHLDGDRLYLRKCIELYQQLGLQVHGVHVNEKEMAHQIGDLIDKINPDVVVITGHDAFSKNKGQKSDLNAYRHSKYFVETVREARRKVPHLDQMIIFAGACQSHFESLIRAGANFASSPSRINIHALDPVYIIAKISYTPFMDKVNVHDVLRNTLTGERGLGGVETRGLMRTGMPYESDDQPDLPFDMKTINEI
ncbi:peptidase [Pontibacillus halophilus JSM 076056 = DSM 19796]|uniref:Peptidase n=1 Tax=Pontibacillus halophilus JSM 076056 = DSM 19796 TaxID=1385510 RepID=A0A0A5GG64_9BACI|nr:sporulation peptidase YabG [Pontibacillus halophilus]KGX90090.1 peptidase [Pontibacillus halophilus JSM 076056 = DSM 19796]